LPTPIFADADVCLILLANHRRIVISSDVFILKVLWSQTLANNNHRSVLLGVVAAVCVLFFWTGWIVISRLGVTSHLTVYDVTGLRYSIGAAVALPYIIRIRNPAPGSLPGSGSRCAWHILSQRCCPTYRRPRDVGFSFGRTCYYVACPMAQVSNKTVSQSMA